MKKTIALCALVAGSATGAANADIISDLGMIGPLNSQANGGVISESFQIAVPAGLDIIGFAFEGIYDESAPGSWASDTMLMIETPGGLTLTVGGISTPTDIDWDFQGGISNDPGFYSHETVDWSLGAVAAEGVWTITFTNDWNSTSAGAITWDEAVFTLIEIPGPGALALLGLAGLASRRRR